MLYLEAEVVRSIAAAIALFILCALLTPALGAEMYVVGNVVNVRSGGGMDYPVISQVYTGQRLELLGQEGNWSNVRLPGGAEGWIYSPLLSATPPRSTSERAAEEAKRYMEVGNQYFYKGLYEDAIEQYRKALDATRNNADAHYNIANSYQLEGLSEKAIEEYLKAIGIKPDHLQARNNLALVYFEQGKYRKAVEEWEKALEYGADYIEVNYNLARGYEKVDMDRAMKQWRRYLELARDKKEEAEFVSKVEKRLERLLEE